MMALTIGSLSWAENWPRWAISQIADRGVEGGDLRWKFGLWQRIIVASID
jgi:hypothetical protein